MHFTSKAKRLAIKVTAFAGMAVMLCVMIHSYRAREAEMARLQRELDVLNTECYALSMRGNAIQMQINQADEDAFIERVARREYGYTNAGEIHYTISNLPSGLIDYDAAPAGEAQEAQ